jgi:D-alanyl-lipoteichoic acid acyltransferase DltB (MBOAT superfamily)
VKKLVISDQLAMNLVDRVFERPINYSALEVLAGVYGYAVQIYCDFSGYTDIAIGSALLLGVRFPKNFDAPYKATNLADFWRRWHISLSTWLRDYLYIPLGGSRGSAWQTYRNLMLTMVLGGLWHGAAWTFLAWGLFHGVLLVADRAVRAAWLRRALPPPGAALRGVIAGATFIAVTALWVFFRAPDFNTAFRLLRAMAGEGVAGARVIPAAWERAAALTIPLALAATHVSFRARSIQSSVDEWPSPMRALVLGALITALVLFSNDDRAFIYFQF